MIEILKEYNTIFIQNNAYGEISKEEIFHFDNHNSKLILTAPHSTRSFCSKQEKKADSYTGAIVKYLSRLNDISNITRTKFVAYKSLISDFVADNNLQNHYFLDIHGFKQNIDYDICLGTGYFDATGYPFLEEIIEVIKTYKLKYDVNHPHYMGRNGLTGRYQRQFSKPNVIQMELSYELRDFYGKPEMFCNTTAPMLNEIINIYR